MFWKPDINFGYFRHENYRQPGLENKLQMWTNFNVTGVNVALQKREDGYKMRKSLSSLPYQDIKGSIVLLRFKECVVSRK